MSRMNRRRFTWMATGGVASAALVACGGDAVEDDLTPTRIPDVEGAPPTLAPNATPFDSEGAGGGEKATPVAEDGGGGEAVTVTAHDDFSWDPAEFEAAPGQDIHVVNGGALQHDFYIDELGIETELLNGGEEVTVTIPEDAEVGAEYVYYCAVPGHREQGMEGTLTIVEASAGGGEAAADEGDEAAAGGGGGEAITVTAHDDFSWDPAEFEAAPGQEIHVVNGGVLQHDFYIDELGIETEMLNGGDEVTVTIPEDAEVGAEYIYYCSVPGHREQGMEGTLTIVEA